MKFPWKREINKISLGYHETLGLNGNSWIAIHIFYRGEKQTHPLREDNHKTPNLMALGLG